MEILFIMTRLRIIWTYKRAIQYKAGLLVSGSWKGTNRAKLYKELGWESLSDRRHIRRLMLYYKINANLTPRYLKDCMDQCPPATTARLKNFFFFLIARNTGTFSRLILDLSPLMVSLSQLFSSLFVQPNSLFLVLLMSVRPTKQSVFGITNVNGLKFLTQLRVDLNDLRVHRFRHGCTNCRSPICVCGTENESTSHFLHRCPRFTTQRNELYTKIRSLDAGDSFFSLPPDDFTTALLYGTP